MKPDGKKPKAFIFDLDGTLAELNSRSPFEWHRVIEDELKSSVAEVLHALRKSGYKIILFTGRDHVAEEGTLEWLKKHNLIFDHFEMRPFKSTEKDFVIKRRMYDKIKDDYEVVGVFEDRDQVVKMWRELGLTCFQVDYGDF